MRPLIYSVNISRKMDEPFGFALRGSQIGTIQKNSPAHKIGLIRVGDTLLKINNITISELINDNVVSLVKDSGPLINLKLSRDYGKKFTKTTVNGLLTKFEDEPQYNTVSKCSL